MKIVKRIFLVLILLVLLLAVIGFFLPAKVHVERSIGIKATPDRVFNYVNGFRNFNKWSPWHKLDTAASYTFEGPENGVGASMAWKSTNSDVGAGRQVITEVIPNEMVKMELYFMDDNKPAYATYQVMPEAEGVKFTWSMDADMGMNPFMRWMGLMMGMMGKVFEQGLESLKSNIENMADAPDYPVELTTVPVSYYLAVRDTVSIPTIGQKLGQFYGMVGNSIQKQNLKMVGSPFAIYYTESSTNWEMDAAIPVDKPGKEDGRVKPGTINAGNVVVVHYTGSYEGTPAGHEAAHNFIQSNNKKIIGAPWEVYITDPMMEKDTAKWKTDIFYPVE